MTIDNEDQLDKLRTVGALVARTLTAMGAALEPGMTTRELDDLGRALLEKDGARSAPELTYDFPGATCISVGPDCAHGIPGDTVIKAGDLINIDVSAELDGYFGDTGASFSVPPTTRRVERLCRDGRRAMWAGIRAVRPGGRLNEVGRQIEAFATKNGYSLVRNLASHGVGRSLHDAPKEIPTWHEPRDRRVITEGLVFTIEPFLSLGADWVEEQDDGWTLRPPKGQPTVQYEHTLVATRNGPLVLTLA
ncbi:type I methionyl aminopeptidase [Caulobacter flavus]|uniref:Methionine aminopeptidase n=1 Tax=Caulobacter flavus TaxID=1679497 RepID=A0A2N5CYX8_9CAUL|nr:type I methionyl aminopeptidase [Caulobacter flavus]AYV45310.1 type I methionyl aminopeptidase [Caulobacter flavus]PLR19011.1 type I methionyl aminopeptidase [Caulobacter flavus]